MLEIKSEIVDFEMYGHNAVGFLNAQLLVGS
jgi:hypothetical protein